MQLKGKEAAEQELLCMGKKDLTDLEHMADHEKEASDKEDHTIASRLSFPATGPPALELIFKPRETQRIIDFDTFLKRFRRVLEGVLKGF